MAPIAAPPGLSLPEEMEVRAVQPPPGLSLPQQSRTVAPPPGFAPIEHGKKVSPPPGLSKIPEDGQATAEEVQPKSIFSIADHLGITDDEPAPRPPVLLPAPVPAPVHGVKGYHELQKSIYEKEKLEKKMQRLEALERLEAMVVCVEELDAIQKKVDSLADRESKKAEKQLKQKQQQPVAQPCPWTKKESKSHPGKFYYVNSKSGKTSWTKPEDYVDPQDVVPVATKPMEKLGLSDYDGSTDACSSESDYDSDFFARSVSSRTSSTFKSAFRVDAPVFKPSVLTA